MLRIRRLIALGALGLLLVVMLSSGASAKTNRALHGTVSVSKEGTGSGTVTSNPGGISCGSVCSYSFTSTDNSGAYRPVELTATPADGSAFTGWSGYCSGMSCVIDPLERGVSYSVVANFAKLRPKVFPLSVSTVGSGRVRSDPTGIDCDPLCSSPFPTDSTVTLTAKADPGWAFAGWSGDCVSTDGNTCTVTMSDPRVVTANFAPPNTVYALAVSAAGGTVTSSFGGISCGALCTGQFAAGAKVILSAGGAQVKWGGDCAGESVSCTLQMSQPRAVTASMDGAAVTTVPVAVGVFGKGKVTGPAPIDCGEACTAFVAPGTTLTLQATPEAGRFFVGWSGSCTVVARTCELTATKPLAVRAGFATRGARFSLAVTTGGKGTVRSKPSGIDCGKECSGRFAAGSSVELEAIAQKGWRFDRWAGNCKGEKRTCTLTMSGPQSASAQFARAVPPRVKALASTGLAGSTVQLRYKLTSPVGRTRESALIYSGARQVARVRGPMHALDESALYYFLAWRAPLRFAGETLRFCVTSTDARGGASKRSCAPLRLS